MISYDSHSCVPTGSLCPVASRGLTLSTSPNVFLHGSSVKNTNWSWDSCSTDTKQLAVALSPGIPQGREEVRWLTTPARKVLSRMRCLCKTIWLLQLFLFCLCFIRGQKESAFMGEDSPQCSDLFYDILLQPSARGTEERKEHWTWSQEVCIWASALWTWEDHLTS